MPDSLHALNENAASHVGKPWIEPVLSRVPPPEDLLYLDMLVWLQLLNRDPLGLNCEASLSVEGLKLHRPGRKGFAQSTGSV